MPLNYELNSWLESQIDRRESLGLSRSAKVVKCSPEYNFGTNDYLALSVHPDVRRSLEEATRVGSSASRLVSGTTEAHQRCENLLSQISQRPAAMLYGSGYHANLGLLQGLVRRDDIVIADRLLHASMLDGVRLSAATLKRFSHNDTSDLERCLKEAQSEIKDSQRVYLLTESLFSINGDQAPLVKMADLAQEYGAVFIVDEAHAFSVYGPKGGGLVPMLGLNDRVEVVTASFAKGVGTYGGFIACSELLKEFLIGCSRSYIYSTALPPSLVEATCCSLELIEGGSIDRNELFSNVELFTNTLNSLDVEVSPDANSYIVPIYCKGNEHALALSQALFAKGIFAYPMRSPTVPKGRECLRFSITLQHTPESLARTAQVLSDSFRAVDV